VKRFTDNQGHVWALTIDVAQMKRVRGLLSIDLYRLADDGLRPLAELLSDPMRLADVLFALVIDQANAAKVSDEDFGRGLAGDALQQAAEAFTEELIDFFPALRDRLTLKKLHGKTMEVAAALADERDKVIDTMIPADEARRIVRAMVPRRSSGGAPESSAPTPADGPSAS
jgi:hypothetical protein